MLAETIAYRNVYIMSAMLPVMQTDIMLTQGEKTLIIDAKYGCAWVYTRCLVSLSLKIDYIGRISLQS